MEANNSLNFFEKIKISGCAFRWNYPVIKYDRAQVRSCCQVSYNEKIDSSLLSNLGTDVFLNSPYVIERRKEMLNGVKHSDCAPCWKLEEAGIQSMRQSAQPLDKYLNLTENSESDPTILKSAKPRILEIQLDNVCDLACVYCNADYSTTWAKKTGKSFEKPDKAHLENFQSSFWAWYETIVAELDGVCIIGGEPLASPHFFKVLEQLRIIHDRNSKNIHKQQFLSITSNFNARTEIFSRYLGQLDLINKFFNLSLNASCEAVGEKAEFIRDGLNWTRFSENVTSLLQYIKKTKSAGHPLRLDFSLHAAQNVFSVSCVPEFLTWALQLEKTHDVAVNLIQNIVSYPAHLSAQSILTKDFSKYCHEGIKIIESHKSNYVYVDNATWELYSKFLSSIAVGLESRNPDQFVQKHLKKWVLDLPEARKASFEKNFTDVSGLIRGIA